MKKLIKFVYEKADVVTAPSQELVKELRSYGLTNVVHLPNGVKLKRFTTTAKDIARFKKKIGPGKKIILYLGRISFEKKLDVLLHAFRMIEEDDRMLLIAGKGPYLKTLKNLAKALEIRNIRFVGFLNERDLPCSLRMR